MQHTRRVLLPIACPQSAPESSVCKRPREVRPSVRGTWYRRIITDSRTILCDLACVRLGAFAYVCCLRIHEPTSAESDNDQQQSKQQLLAHTHPHTAAAAEYNRRHHPHSERVREIVNTPSHSRCSNRADVGVDRSGAVRCPGKPPAE